MTRHLLKLVWKRKRANALLIVEIFASFLVVFAVVTLASSLVLRWGMPIGFDYHDVWRARVDFGQRAEMQSHPNLTPQRLALEAMARELRTLPQIESVAVCDTPPYMSGTWQSNMTVDGRRAEVWRDSVSDDYAKVLKMPVLRGRFFNADDEVATQKALVLDADAARALFGTVDIIGRTIDMGRRGPGDDSDTESHIGRVVGVVAPFRKNGELGQERDNFVFERYSFRENGDHVAREIVMRLRPGTPADFEQTLLHRLHGVAPDYPARIEHMEQNREMRNKVFMAPALIGGIVAAFLITMVALGLSGVLWQTVTRRTREIGLRRALGATGSEVHRQILLEVALLSTLALVIGVILVAQLPLIGLFRIVTPAAYSVGILGSLATIYGLTLLCGLYPSWLAGRVQPAQALHYE